MRVFRGPGVESQAPPSFTRGNVVYTHVDKQDTIKMTYGTPRARSYIFQWFTPERNSQQEGEKMRQSIGAHIICQAAAPTAVLTDRCFHWLCWERGRALEDPGASLSGNRPYGGETSHGPFPPIPIHWILIT